MLGIVDLIEGFIDYIFEGIDMFIDICYYCGLYYTLNVFRGGLSEFRSLLYMYNTIKIFKMRYDLMLPSWNLYIKYSRNNKNNVDKDMYILASLSIISYYYNEKDSVINRTSDYLNKVYEQEKFINAQKDLLMIY